MSDAGGSGRQRMSMRWQRRRRSPHRALIYLVSIDPRKGTHQQVFKIVYPYPASRHAGCIVIKSSENSMENLLYNLEVTTTRFLSSIHSASAKLDVHSNSSQPSPRLEIFYRILGCLI